MFWIFKNKTLESHFNGVRSVKISGVKFKIKKLDALDHLQGLNVLQKIHDTYKVGKDAPANHEVTLESINKIKKYCRDIILGGVVSPKLAAGDNQDGFPVDKIIGDLPMAQALAKAILTYTYKKIDRQIKFVPSRLAELDWISKRYKVLPSQIAKLPPDEIQFNLLVASEGSAMEMRAAEKAKKEAQSNGKKR